VNAESWQQVEKIFHETLEREPHERASFLVQSCAGDASLLSEVEALVRGHATVLETMFNRTTELIVWTETVQAQRIERKLKDASLH